MEPERSIADVARRQVRAVLRRWDPEPTSDFAGAPAALEDLVEPILAALTFDPSAQELAAELQSLAFARLHARPSWAECFAAARDLVDGHRSLFVSIIDAG